MNKRFIFFFCWVFIPFFNTTLARQMEDGYHFQVPLKPEVWMEDSPTSVMDVLKNDQTGLFENLPSVGVAQKGKTYWLKLDFTSHLPLLEQSDTIYIYPGNLDISKLFFAKGGGLDSLNLSRLTPNDLSRATLHSLEYVKVASKDFFDGYFLLIRAEFQRASPDLDVRTIRFSDSKSHEIFSQFISESSFKSQVLAFFFLGIASVLMIFNLILFFNMRERQYIYYGAFLLFQLIYYSQISPYLATSFGYNTLYFYFWLTTIAQLLINLSYLLFIRHFLEFPKLMPGFDRLVLAIAGLLILLVLVNSGLIFFKPYSLVQAYLMDFQRYFMAAFAFFGVGYLFFYYPNKLKYFVISATLIFTTGALMTMFLLDLDYMVAGSSIESIIFALGLSYKIKVISQEKRKVENEAFQTKLGALRAQINPHFIFNSLSSIQHLISSGQKEAALSYLSKFSKFVRQVLENSIDVHVTLDKEVELLKVYLDLESLRFDHAFSYTIETPPHFDLSFFEVPMLIVQPFVENAIKHGLMAKTDGERKLTVRFVEESHHIRCEVEDNGIGRKASAAMKKSDYRPSRGMALTEERLRLINREKKETQIQIDDLPAGTRITIKFPKP